jgi:membrane associated rhomboid family serine protease
MIPISDNVFLFTRKRPIVTYSLIGVNVFLFLWELILEFNGQLGTFVNTWGLVPAQISAAASNLVAGNSAAGILFFWRSISLMTGMFIHASFSQIIANVLFLWVFGQTLEKVLGGGRFVVFYLLCGIMTGVVQVLAEPSLNVPLIGANGAIAAILGAYILKFPKVKIYTVIPLLIVFIPVDIPAFLYIFLWLLQHFIFWIGSLEIPNGANSFSLGYWSHCAGLVIGATTMAQLQRR